MSTELQDESKYVAVISFNKAVPWRELKMLESFINNSIESGDVLVKPHIDQNSLPQKNCTCGISTTETPESNTCTVCGGATIF